MSDLLSRMFDISERLLLPVAIVVVVVMLLSLSQVISPTVVIRGGYVLLGILLAAVIYYGTKQQRFAETTRQSRRESWYGKVTVITLLVTVSIAAITDSRALATVLTLPVAYFLVILQLRRGASIKQTLPQISLLFFVSPFNKYLTTGYYLPGDILAHVLFVRELMTSGNIANISSPLYPTFPGMHMLVAKLSILTGLRPYDALMILGVITFTAIVPLIYLIARPYFGHRPAIAMGLAITMFSYVHYFATYFIAQSFAIVLGLYVIYTVIKTTETGTHKTTAVILLSILLISALTVSHHFTNVLYTPIVAILMGTELVLSRVTRDRGLNTSSRILFLLWMVITLTYWVERGGTFFIAFAQISIEAIEDGINTLVAGSGQGTGRSLYGFGRAIPELTVESAIGWFVTPQGLFYVLLTTFTVLAFLSVLAHRDRYRRGFFLLVPAIVGTAFVMKTPVVIRSYVRIQVIWFFVFVFLFGVAVYHIIQNYRQHTAPFGTLSVILLIILGTIAPIAGVAGDDIQNFDNEMEPQVTVAEGEFEAYRATAVFTSSYSEDVYGLLYTNQLYRHFNSDISPDVTVSQDGLTVSPGLFVFRSSWSSYRIFHSRPDTPYGPRIFMSENWLKNATSRESVVYSNSHAGTIWVREKSVISGD